MGMSSRGDGVLGYGGSFGGMLERVMRGEDGGDTAFDGQCSGTRKEVGMTFS